MNREFVEVQLKNFLTEKYVQDSMDDLFDANKQAEALVRILRWFAEYVLDEG